MTTFKEQLENREFDAVVLSDAQMQEIVKLKTASLVFTNCQLTKSNMEVLATMHKLVNLTMERCSLTDDHIAPLAALPKLNYLFVNDNLITGQGFINFIPQSKIQCIWLDNNPVDDAGWKVIAQLPNLGTVRIYGTQITFQGLMATALNPMIKPISKEIEGEKNMFTAEQILAFRKQQICLAKVKLDADPTSVEDASASLQGFFDAYTTLEKLASELENGFCQEIQNKYTKLMEQYCSKKSAQNKLQSYSSLEPFTFGGHQIIENEKISKNKMWLYTIDNQETIYRSQMTYQDNHWVIEKMQYRSSSKWEKAYY